VAAPDVIVDGITVPGMYIDALRGMIGESALSDEQLATVLVANRNDDGTFNLNRAASDVWLGKAAQYAELVDVSESGSSRKLSDLHKNALTMAARYGSDDEAAATGARRSRTRAIVRPTA
jgi:hypothetical protein